MWWNHWCAVQDLNPRPKDSEWVDLGEATGPKSCGYDHGSGRCRSEFVITTDSGTILDHSKFTRHLRAAVKAAGLPHACPRPAPDLREYASWLLQGSRSLADVGKLLGHVSRSPPSVTPTSRIRRRRDPRRDRRRPAHPAREDAPERRGRAGASAVGAVVVRAGVGASPIPGWLRSRRRRLRLAP